MLEINILYLIYLISYISYILNLISYILYLISYSVCMLFGGKLCVLCPVCL